MLNSRRASAHYRHQRLLARLAASEFEAFWAQIEPGNIRATWQLVLPAAVAATHRTSIVAGRTAGPYVAGIVTDAGAAPAGFGINPHALVDQTLLRRRLAIPALRALQRVEGGEHPSSALRAAGSLGQVIAAQTVRDTARDAVHVAMVADTQIAGWVRYLRGSSCGRCAVLAGRFYSWSDGFKRHPRCDCQHRPVARPEANQAREGIPSPETYFQSLSKTEQDKRFGAGVAERIRDGEDIRRAVNANRGMWRDSKSSRRGVGDLPRPIVADVMAEARGSRAAAIAKFREYGLITAPGTVFRSTARIA